MGYGGLEIREKGYFKNAERPNIVQVLTLVIVIGIFVTVLVSMTFVISINSNDANVKLTYAEIKNSLLNGEKLRVIMHYKYTNFYFNDTIVDPSPDEISGFDLQDYQYFARGVIGNKLEYLITSFIALIQHPRYGPMYDYGKVRLYETGNFEIEVFFLDARTFNIILTESMNATMSSGAIEFYQQTPRFRKFF